MPNIGTAIQPRDSIRRMADLAPDENERLRAAMREACASMFDGNVTSLAKAMGRSQPSISDFLNGVGGASLDTARRFAAIVGRPVWQVLGASTSPGAVDRSAAAGPLPALPATIELDRAEQAHVLAAMSKGVTADTVLEVLTTTFGKGANRPSPEELYQMLRGAQGLRDRSGPIGTPITEATSKEVLPSLEDVKARRALARAKEKDDEEPPPPAPKPAGRGKRKG